MSFAVRVARTHIGQPVNLSLLKPPDGVTAAEVQIPPAGNQADIELAVLRDVPVGTERLRVQAQIDVPGGALIEAVDLPLEVLKNTAPPVDVVFVLDLTSSMQFAIDGIKDGIQSFAARLEKNTPDARIGLVGFRDIEDDKERPFVLMIGGKSLTQDFKAFKQEVARLMASGGGDEPESSVQGLALAADQPFRQEAVRILVLITDAPPKFHQKERVRTVSDAIAILKKKRVDQVHMIVNRKEYDKDFAPLRKAFKGGFLDLQEVSKAANKAAAFEKLLPRLSEEITKITGKDLPALPVVAAPPLPPATPAPPSAAAAPAPPTVPEAPPPAETPALPVAQAADALPPPPPAPAVLKAVQSTEQYSAENQTRLLLALVAWTMVIATCICLPLRAGQAFYARQGLVTLSETGRGLAGGLLAGLVGGAAGQLFFQATSGGTAWEILTRIVSWSLLGGLIGGGMSLFVPNLKWYRGILGGVLGGFLGALAFLAADLVLGGLPGRCIGSAILGFCIGLMIALAELVFRRWWLEIAFSPREVRTVTLGSAPVTIGGDERRTSVFVQGAVAVAYRFSVRDNRVLCEDPVAQRTLELRPGETRTIGKVRITLCSTSHARKIGYRLQLSNGKAIRLTEGMPLTAEDLPGLEPAGTDGIVALITTLPNDPGKLLLRNRSRSTWSSKAGDGTVATVAPTRSVTLGEGLQVAFGSLSGTLGRDAV